MVVTARYTSVSDTERSRRALRVDRALDTSMCGRIAVPRARSAIARRGRAVGIIATPRRAGVRHGDAVLPCRAVVSARKTAHTAPRRNITHRPFTSDAIRIRRAMKRHVGAGVATVTNVGNDIEQFTTVGGLSRVEVGRRINGSPHVAHTKVTHRGICACVGRPTDYRSFS